MNFPERLHLAGHRRCGIIGDRQSGWRVQAEPLRAFGPATEYIHENVPGDSKDLPIILFAAGVEY